MERKHTPTPWSLGKVRESGDSRCQHFQASIHCGEAPNQGNAVASAYCGNLSGAESCLANAEFIVEAVNSHDALKAKVEAAEKMAEALAGVVAVADRKTDEFDKARAALEAWKEACK